MEKIYKAEEIVRNNHSKSLWIVIHGSVYNLTEFCKEHPGGEEVLLELAGKDGSKCFDSIGHSVEAIRLRDCLKIGEMEKGAILEEPEAKPVTKASIDQSKLDDQRQKQDEEEQKEEDKSFIPLIAAAVVIYAFIVYYIWFW
ncbi:cytochrome b5-like [Odontomachus brunneus]|uniref:cytochrome b5-like n=1 Tax=Odontomachus brunneus TaxID=486640 RepID=UPI0013F1B4DC|nr:cytochrome b5-like [Odontomachus brunneus]XP_032675938.1 cytochrome b5-like [Odontomachus brunneus]XP_032675939.1 cytochrome b5-like [Odontomachus brunneus]